MRFLQYINEKLNPSEFRQYVKTWKESGMNKQFDNVFKGKDRIYIDYTPVRSKAGSDHEEAITLELEKYGWKMEDYIKGLASKNNRTMKIGKVLQGLIDKKVENYGYIEVLLRYFQRDEVRQASKGDFLICISRHAYDIAGMSTDRGWTSCQDLRDGDMNDFVLLDVQAGTLIAYLIRNDDKNLQHPLGRVLLKPYVNKENDEKILIAVTKKYGEFPVDFPETVQKWADKKLNKNKYGMFRRHGDVYPEGKQIEGRLPKKNREEFLKKYELVIDKPEDLINIAKKHFDWLKKWYKEIYQKELPDQIWFNYDMKFTSEQMLEYFIDVYNRIEEDNPERKAYNIFYYSLYHLKMEEEQKLLYAFLSQKVLDKQLLHIISAKWQWDESNDVNWLRPSVRDRYWKYFQRIQREVGMS